ADLQSHRPLDFVWLDVPTLLDDAVDDDLDLARFDPHAAKRAYESLGVLAAWNVELHHDDVHIRSRDRGRVVRVDAHDRIDDDVVEHAPEHAEQALDARLIHALRVFGKIR